MKRVLLIAAAAAFLPGCAGLQTGWVLQLQMQYVTPQDKPATPARSESAGRDA